jgi:hypothetical protein
VHASASDWYVVVGRVVDPTKWPLISSIPFPLKRIIIIFNVSIIVIDCVMNITLISSISFPIECVIIIIVINTSNIVLMSAPPILPPNIEAVHELMTHGSGRGLWQAAWHRTGIRGKMRTACLIAMEGCTGHTGSTDTSMRIKAVVHIFITTFIPIMTSTILLIHVSQTLCLFRILLVELTHSHALCAPIEWQHREEDEHNGCH